MCTELTKCSAQPFVTLFYSGGGGGLLLPSVLSGGWPLAESPYLGTCLLASSCSLLPFTSGSRYMHTHTLLQFCVIFYNCLNLE